MMFVPLSRLLCGFGKSTPGSISSACRSLCSAAEGSPPTTPPAAEEIPVRTKPRAKQAIRLVDFSRLDVRVGRITTCALHPANENWFITGVDVGDERDRPVVCGMPTFYTIEEMTGRLVVAFCNIRPGNFREIPSMAMLWAARRDEDVELLSVPAESQPGDRIFVNEFTHEEMGPPDKTVHPKKTMYPSIMEDIKVVSHKATFRGFPIRTPRGFVTTVKFQDAMVS